VEPGEHFPYCDPLHQLSTVVQRQWQDPIEQERMVQEALAKAHVR
jgi:hypothetical protein